MNMSAILPPKRRVAMQKSHECHSEPQAKNLAFSAAFEAEILRLIASG